FGPTVRAVHHETPVNFGIGFPILERPVRALRSMVNLDPHSGFGQSKNLNIAFGPKPRLTSFLRCSSNLVPQSRQITAPTFVVFAKVRGVPHPAFLPRTRSTPCQIRRSAYLHRYSASPR